MPKQDLDPSRVHLCPNDGDYMVWAWAKGIDGKPAAFCPYCEWTQGNPSEEQKQEARLNEAFLVPLFA